MIRLLRGLLLTFAACAVAGYLWASARPPVRVTLRCEARQTVSITVYVEHDQRNRFLHLSAFSTGDDGWYADTWRQLDGAEARLQWVFEWARIPEGQLTVFAATHGADGEPLHEAMARVFVR